MDRTVESGVAVTLEEYFATAHEYEVEPDFVDGFLKDRCIGEMPHASAMCAVLMAVNRQQDRAACRALPSLSLQVSPTRVRIVDVCLLPVSYRKAIPDQPPLLCVEVLGSEDTLAAMALRCEDYLQMGVRDVWIVDPWREEGYVLTSGGTLEKIESEFVAIDGTVSVTLDEVFERYSGVARARELR